MTVTADLDQIIAKVRKVTARPSANQITDAQIIDYINMFYLYDFPEQLRLLNLKVDYTINLEPNVAEYDFDTDNYTTIQFPAYVDGYEIQMYQDKQTFYQFFPEIRSTQELITGTAIAGPYTATITNTPIIPNTLYISFVDGAGTTVSVTDNGSGTLTGDCLAGGTVNYQTGAIAGLTFTSVVPLGTIVYSHVSRYKAARPAAFLFYQDKFYFRPIPDISYQFTITAFKVPTSLLVGSTTPQLKEWWELLAYGASLKILADNGDMEKYQQVDFWYEKKKKQVERRTIKQLSTQRTNTIYSQYDYYPYSGQYPYM